MCGIAGIWNAQPTAGALTTVRGMLAAMGHRGPDGSGTHPFEGGAVGMVRLALVDLSARAQQPLWSRDGKVAIVFNGEMYNFRAERARLADKGYVFSTTSDTEVVLALYLERGIAFVERLRGMYAIAMFDWRETRVGALPAMLLARDPFGIKPLYVATLGSPSSIIFASELKALLASGSIQHEVDRQGLFDYLFHGFIIQPRTILKGVRMLGPGVVETYAPGRPIESRKFWRLSSSEPRKETLEEASDRLRNVLDESVALHAIADAPIGAFLSGGIDSTAIVALMRKHVARLRTYTLRLPEVPGADEAAEATLTAESLGCENTVVDVTGGDVKDALPKFAADLDQPSTDGLNTWLISRAAGRDVKAVLSGLGGDEWFAGYPVTRRMARTGRPGLGWLARATGRTGAATRRFVPAGRFRSRLDDLAARRSPLAMWIHAHSVFSRDEAGGMAGVRRTGDETADARAILDDATESVSRESPIGMSCILDVCAYMRNQLLRDCDATSMAHSLELRVPFVDVEVAAFSRSCHDDFKLRRDGERSLEYSVSGAKQVLIHALRDVLPRGIDTRPKRGFALPFERWMRGELRSIVDDACHPGTVARRGLVDPDLIAPLYATRDRGGVPGTLYPKLWSLTILELWCRTVLDRPRGIVTT